jgi:GT2 family glycosyltransferase
MIYFFQPWAYDGHLGKAYNDYMRLLPSDEDWAVLMDGDTCFLTATWGEQIRVVIERNPGVAMFSCLTNRVGNLLQCYKGELSEDPDITRHRKIAVDLAERVPYASRITRRVISGHMMVIQKATWKKYPFAENYNFLSVDNDISRRMLLKGESIRIMLGVYVFHYYRLLEGRKFTKHLIK